MDMCLLKMHQQAKVRKGAGISHWYLVRGDALVAEGGVSAELLFLPPDSYAGANAVRYDA